MYLFFTDCDGNVVLASDPDDLAGDVVEASVLEQTAKAQATALSRYLASLADADK